MGSLLKTYYPSLIAVFITGALLPFAFAPFSLWLLAILSPFFFLLASGFILQKLDKENSKQTRKVMGLVAFSYWLGFYVFGVSWVFVSIHEYGYTPAPLAAILSLLFCAGLALFNTAHSYLFFYFRLYQFAPFAFPASWVLMEWSRSWFLTGFPWLYNGYAFIDTPLASLASIGGVYLLSFASILMATCLYLLAEKYLLKNNSRQYQVMIASFLLLAIPFTGLVASKVQWVEEDPEQALEVHLLQGNIPQHEKWLPENQRKILHIYNDLIQESIDRILATDKPEQRHLIVLPEAAMPTLQSELSWFFELVEKKTEGYNIALSSGIFYDQDGKGFLAENIYNSIITIGKGSGLYHKQRLVPFGEYVPLEDFIRGWIPFFDLPYSSFTRGTKDQQGLQVFDFNIAPFICYEILYPELVFNQAQDSDVLITISNDAWFGNSSGPQQHFQMARMRALELGKYLIRTTNTGTTAIIDPYGGIADKLENNTRNILHGEVYKTRGRTPFSFWGNLPALLLSVVLMAGCLLAAQFKKTSTAKQTG